MRASTCKHVLTVALRKRRRGHRTVVQPQCSRCRAPAGDAVDSSLYTLAELQKFPIWQPKRPSRPSTKRRRDFKKNTSSARLRKLKNAVFARDNFTCRVCGEPATDLGHIDYSHFGNESEDDLLSQCSSCNQAERQRRIGGGHH